MCDDWGRPHEPGVGVYATVTYGDAVEQMRSRAVHAAKTPRGKRPNHHTPSHWSGGG